MHVLVVHESRTCDPDPGTPGDLDPSRMRQLLHRKGVAGYMIKQTDLHARLVAVRRSKGMHEGYARDRTQWTSIRLTDSSSEGYR